MINQTPHRKTIDLLLYIRRYMIEVLKGSFFSFFLVFNTWMQLSLCQRLEKDLGVTTTCRVIPHVLTSEQGVKYNMHFVQC